MSTSGMYHNYVVTAHKPTKVTHTQVGNFMGGSESNLLVGKVTYVDVYTITKEGLVPTLELPIYGRMAIMKLFRRPGEKQDSLLVLTEKRKLFVIRWNPKTEQSVTLTSGDVLENVSSPNVRVIGIVDPKARCVALRHMQHFLKVLSTDYAAAGGTASFNVRLAEDDVKDVVFLNGFTRPTVALLYKENESAFMRTYEISMSDEEISEGKWSKDGLDPTANMLVAVPGPACGLLVIGCHSIMYISERGHCINQPMDTAIIKALGMIDQQGSRFLMGDHRGNLILLVLSLDPSGKFVEKLQLQNLGETSVATCISYLDNGYVYIGSESGDSQLIRLQAMADPKTNSYLTVVQSYPHLGPITDFCIVKGMGYLRQGQGQVVTCSGMGKDGSLRVIRNGIGITEQASADLPGIKAMFSLRRHLGDEYHSFIMQSFMSETRTLELLGEFDMAPTSLSPLDENKPTLHAANVVGDQIVQVTDEGVRLLDCVTMSGNPNPAWMPPPNYRVSHATGNSQQILLATNGGNLVHLDVDGPNKTVRETGRVTLENEISCLDCSTLVLGSKEEGMILPEERSRIGVVGLWADVNKSPVVKIVALPSLETLQCVELGGDVMARSVLLATLEGSNYLLVGLGDGYLLTYSLNLSNAIEAIHAKTPEKKAKLKPIVGDGRKLNVGTQPANLSIFRSRGSNHVFAACDRPTVVYAATGVGKLLLSNVNLQGVTRVCSFHTVHFPDCLAIALENSFQLGAVDEIQKLHINKVPLGDQPRRIAHLESARAFAVLTETAGIDDSGEDVLKCQVRLIHDSTYDGLCRFELDKCEVSSSITTCRFKGHGIDEKIEYLVVGTTYELASEEDPKLGRLLVFSVNDSRLSLVAEQKVSGATYCLCPFEGEGKIIAGVNSLVLVYSLQEDPNNNTLHLVKEDVHHGHILAYRIQTRGNYILVGDLMRSLTLLTWKPNSEHRLEEVARDYDGAWTMAVEMLDDDVYVMSEHSKHLLTFRRNSYAGSENERMRLERVGKFHIGALINRIAQGSLVMQLPEVDSAATKTLIFGTADGMIGVIATLRVESYRFFHALQQAMLDVIPGVGGLRHSDWRAFSQLNSPRSGPAKNYIDGDLIERFADLSADPMKIVSEKMEMSVDELLRRVEEMQRLHGAG